MGRKVKRRIYDLSPWLDAEEGLTGTRIVAEGMTIRELLDFNERFGNIGITRYGVPRTEDSDGLVWAYTRFVDRIREWNLEDIDGNPLDISMVSFLSLDPAEAYQILRVYIEAISGVPSPLEIASNSGDTSEVESLPMEAL